MTPQQEAQERLDECRDKLRVRLCECNRFTCIGTPNPDECLVCSIETEIVWARLRQFECEHGPWYKNLGAYERAFPRRVVAA